MPRFLSAACLLLLLGATARGAWAQAGAVSHVHDPSVIREGTMYYLYSTGGTIPVRRSRDLYRWDLLGEVFDALPPWTAALEPADGNIWAPDISRLGNRYLLYYAVSSFGTNRSAIGLATNATLDPASPSHDWVDRGKVIESRPGVDDWNAIDPNLVIDASGIPWLVFGSYWSGIKMRRIDPATGLLSAADPTLYSLAARPGSTAVEAPFIIRSGNHYYLFVSFDQCCQGAESTYHVRVGRSASVKGPYVDFDGRPMLDGGGTLVLKGYGTYRGPGHNAVLEDGGRTWLIHHYYDAASGGIPKLQVRPLLWPGAGWPVPGEPIIAPPGAGFPPSAMGTWEHVVDFEDSSSVRLFSNGRTNDPGSPDSWSLEGADLTLRWPRDGAPGGTWVDEGQIAFDGRSYAGRNQLGTVVTGRRDSGSFIRGDSNGDGVVDISDALFSLFFLYQPRRAIYCTKALDANDDGAVDLSDPISTLRSLFEGGPTILPPGPPGGLDPTADGLGC